MVIARFAAMSEGPTTNPLRATVLMATLNGREWIGEQVRSILDQQGVEVTLVVSDDGSSDGTWEWLGELAATDSRVHLLERTSPSGGHAANFYRLLRDAHFQDSDQVAFVDQDDVWRPGRLAGAAALINAQLAEGVSSDVESFDASESRHVIRKSYAQRRFDYIFESPGPGTSISLSIRLATLVRDELNREGSLAPTMQFHDWLVYGICRAKSWPWVIRNEVTVEYRQHASNAFGANHGFAQARKRLALIHEGWHRRQSITMARVARDVADPAQRVPWDRLIHLLEDRGAGSRWALIQQSNQLRRRGRDRFIMAALIAVGYW